MADELDRDLIASNSLINFLNAILQGKYVALSVKNLFEPSNTLAAKISEATQWLEQIIKWRDGLWSGSYLISADPRTPRSPEAERALKLLSSLREEQLEQATAIVSAFSDKELQQSSSNLTILLSNFAGYAYTMDNHVRGMIDFWLKNKRENEAALLRESLERAEEDVRVANSMVDEYRKFEGQVPPGFVEKLRMETRFVAGVLRAQSVDVQSILFAGEPEVSFADFGFMQLEQLNWQNENFPPLEAAYWSAYDISAKEASLWKSVGIVEPLIAAKWRTFGFGPDYAPAWAAIGFPPILAFAWAQAQFDPPTAAKYVDQGVLTPDQINKKE